MIGQFGRIAAARTAMLALLLLGVSGIALGVWAQDSDEAGNLLMEHVLDGHTWEVLPFVPKIEMHDIVIGPVTIPVTRHVVMMCFTAVLLIVVMAAAFAKPRAVPNRLGMAIEPIVFFVRDALIVPSMGEELAQKWLPFFYTLFFFLLASNMLGLIPLFPTVTGNLSITSALAIISFFSIVIQGMLKRGFVGFFTNMVPEGIPGPIAIFIFCIEVITLFIRSAVLAIRLFANMIAGHFVIFSLLMIMILVHPAAGVVSIPMALFIDLLEVLVAIIQAVVFTMLTAIYIGMASNHH